jgi:hypothetical protein
MTWGMKILEAADKRPDPIGMKSNPEIGRSHKA